MADNKRKLIIEDVDGKEYEIAGTGGGSAQPAPNSVGSSEIEDHSIQEEDLDPSIIDKLNMLDDSNVISEDELSDDWEDAMREAGLNPGTIDQNGGSGDDDNVTAEDLENDWNNAINEAGQELNNG